jgi:hypothetical protein
MSGPDGDSYRIDPFRNVPVLPRSALRTSTESVVFFGNTLGVECQRCGAYNQTSMGHKYCAHVSCPIALREFKRRKRKRTSSLEKVYVPQKLQAIMARKAEMPPVGELAGEA